MIKRDDEKRDKQTPFRPQLGEEIEGMLVDFCDAHHEANMSEVVRRAVRRFIQTDITKNDGVRDVFEALQRKRAKAEEE